MKKNVLGILAGLDVPKGEIEVRDHGRPFKISWDHSGLKPMRYNVSAGKPKPEMTLKDAKAYLAKQVADRGSSVNPFCRDNGVGHNVFWGPSRLKAKTIKKLKKLGMDVPSAVFEHRKS